LIKAKVERLVEKVASDHGIELVEVEYKKEGGRWYLRVFIDKEGGVTLGDCQLVSQELGALLDVHDLISHRYILEVSSPGLTRPLAKERDYQRAVGRLVKIKTRTPIGDKNVWVGVIKGIAGGELILSINKGKDELVIPLSNIAKAKLEIGFK
jgi:ribosome maturation factor RimP